MLSVDILTVNEEQISLDSLSEQHIVVTILLTIPTYSEHNISLSVILFYICIWICTLLPQPSRLELTLKHSHTPTHAYAYWLPTLNTVKRNCCHGNAFPHWLPLIYLQYIWYSPGSHWRKISLVFDSIPWETFHDLVIKVDLDVHSTFEIFLSSSQNKHIVHIQYLTIAMWSTNRKDIWSAMSSTSLDAVHEVLSWF